MTSSTMTTMQQQMALAKSRRDDENYEWLQRHHRDVYERVVAIAHIVNLAPADQLPMTMAARVETAVMELVTDLLRPPPATTTATTTTKEDDPWSNTDK